MSDFWWGVLALPIVVAALAGAASTILGAWLLYEKWAVRRWNRLEDVHVPQKLGVPGKFQTWAAGRFGNRGGYLSLLLAGGRGLCFRLTPSTAVLFISAGKTDVQQAKIIRRALDRALLEVAKDEASPTS